MKSLIVSNLKCEYLSSPLGISMRRPRFSWECSSAVPDVVQKSFHIQVWVASTGQVVWDSGRASSDRQHDIVYEGAALEICTIYEWKVKVSLDNDCVSNWSDVAVFETGFFSIDDWKAGWIGYSWGHIPPSEQSVCFIRNNFNVENSATIKRARAYVASTAGAHGNDTLRMNLYELRINGEKVGHDLYNPGQLSEAKGRALYRTYEITDLILTGENAVGVIYISAKISVELMLEYSDGQILFVHSGPDWQKNRRGPFLRLWRHDVYEYGGKGESYDAREELTGWDTASYDSKQWVKVSNYTIPAEILEAQMQSVEVYERIPPQSITKLNNGRYIVDFGRCLNGHVEINTKGPAGTKVTLLFAENITRDGDIDVNSTLSLQGTISTHEDTYIKRGKHPEPYSPRFANHGFRYVAVDGFNDHLDYHDLHANAVCSWVEETLVFNCSDARVMELYQMCEWTFRSNLMSVCTDCPSRERQGWPADACLVAIPEMTMFDMRLFYEKWFNDMADEQAANGCLPYVAPIPKVRYGSSVAWGGGYLSIAWDSYMAYGNKVFLAKHYKSFRRWGEYLLSIQEENGLSQGHCNYCDHLAKDYPSRTFFENAHAGRAFDLLSQISDVLGFEKEREDFKQNAHDLKEAIHKNFYNNGTYGDGTQSELVHALYLDIAPDDLRSDLLELLCDQLESELCFRTGIFGTYYLMCLLSNHGRHDLAWRLLMSENPRTWRYWLTLGATTAFESWLPAQEGSEYQFTCNHPALLGGMGTWLFREFAGIKPKSPGYKHIRISPFIPDGIAETSVDQKTPYGAVHCSWINRGGKMELRTILPVGVKAEVVLPWDKSIHHVGAGCYCWSR